MMKALNFTLFFIVVTIFAKPLLAQTSTNNPEPMSPITRRILERIQNSTHRSEITAEDIMRVQDEAINEVSYEAKCETLRAVLEAKNLEDYHLPYRLNVNINGASYDHTYQQQAFLANAHQNHCFRSLREWLRVLKEDCEISLLSLLVSELLPNSNLNLHLHFSQREDKYNISSYLELNEPDEYDLSFSERSQYLHDLPVITDGTCGMPSLDTITRSLERIPEEIQIQSTDPTFFYIQNLRNQRRRSLSH